MTDAIARRRFAGSTAVVTGSTRGIGAAVARRFVTEGADVVVTGRSVDGGEAVASDLSNGTAAGRGGGDARFVRADVRDPDDVAALVETTADGYGRIDVLVNNAGVRTETTASAATMDDWAFVLETDFRSFWLRVKHAVEQRAEGIGRRHTSSRTGSRRGSARGTTPTAGAFREEHRLTPVDAHPASQRRVERVCSRASGTTTRADWTALRSNRPGADDDVHGRDSTAPIPLRCARPL